jgi:protein TonB
MRCAQAVLALVLAMGLHAEKPAPVTTAPRIVQKTKPQYTEEARNARVQGSVMLKAELDESGRLIGISVVRGLGYGLDEKAIDCARQWQFEPATRNGVPVRTRVQLEVNFRFLR